MKLPFTEMQTPRGGTGFGGGCCGFKSSHSLIDKESLRCYEIFKWKYTEGVVGCLRPKN